MSQWFNSGCLLSSSLLDLLWSQFFGGSNTTEFLVLRFCRVGGDRRLEKSTISNAYRTCTFIFMGKSVVSSPYMVITFWTLSTTTSCLIQSTRVTWTLDVMPQKEQVHFCFKTFLAQIANTNFSLLPCHLVKEMCPDHHQQLLPLGLPFPFLYFISLYRTYTHPTYDIWPLLFAYWPLHPTIMVGITKSGEFSVLFTIYCFCSLLLYAQSL